MKVVITGGAGLIGSHIADLLVKKNIKKIIIVDDFSVACLLIYPGPKRMEIWR